MRRVRGIGVGGMERGELAFALAILCMVVVLGAGLGVLLFVWYQGF